MQQFDTERTLQRLFLSLVFTGLIFIHPQGLLHSGVVNISLAAAEKVSSLNKTPIKNPVKRSDKISKSAMKDLLSKKDTYVLSKGYIYVPYKANGLKLSIARTKGDIDLYAVFSTLSDSTGKIARACHFDGNCIDELFIEYEAKKHGLKVSDVNSLILNMELIRSTSSFVFGRISEGYDKKIISRFFLEDTYFHFRSFYPIVESAILTSKLNDFNLRKGLEVLFDLNYLSSNRNIIKIEGDKNLDSLNVVALQYLDYFNKNKESVNFSNVIGATMSLYGSVNKLNSVLEIVVKNNFSSNDFNEKIGGMLDNLTPSI